MKLLKYNAVLLLLTALFYWAGCKKDKEKDTTVPSISIVSPLIRDSGTILKNVKIQVNANAFNGKSIRRVEFYVDNVMLTNGIDESFPFEYDWECTEKYGEPRTIKVVGYDNEDISSTATITVRCFNGVAKKPMPTSRYAFTANVVNGKIYVIGGHNTKFFTVEEYDPATDTWTTKAPPPRGHAANASCVINNIIYVFGGELSLGVGKAVDAYNPATNTWTSKADIPQDSGGSVGLNAAAEANGKAYLMGGLVNPEPARVVEYDPVADTWRLTKSYMRNYNAEAVTLNNSVYFIGGCPFRSMSFCDNPSDSMWIYNPTADTWVPQKKMLIKHTGHAATVLNNKIYVMGGVPHHPILPNKSMEVYDLATDTWKELPFMPDDFLNFSCCAVNGKIYIIGEDVMYEYTPD